ncbi:hypothetical protein LZ30DRAFT_723424 [Colletotrichum cereale]|nr:hypothetical protein LZ30DRAFT_723424 [Colletotrichum cereale]
MKTHKFLLASLCYFATVTFAVPGGFVGQRSFYKLTKRWDGCFCDSVADTNSCCPTPAKVDPKTGYCNGVSHVNDFLACCLRHGDVTGNNCMTTKHP